MNNINKKLLIKLYNQGKTNIEISNSLKVSDRTIERMLARLRIQGKISYRSQLPNYKNTNIIENAQIDYGVLITELSKVIKSNLFKENPYPIINTKGKREETAVLILSDMHTGMRNQIYDSTVGGNKVTYNTPIRKAEMLYLRNSIFQIQDLFTKAYKIDHLIIFILGDMITNDRIYEGQIFSIEKAVGNQVMDVVVDLTYFINEMKHKFNKITLVTLVGNHGRSTERYQEEPVENNFEWFQYKLLQKTFDNDKRVKIIVPNSRSYIYEIYGHRYLLTHGDSLRGSTRNYIERGIKDLLVAHESDFDVFIMGHFHRADKMSLSEHTVALVNGGWIPKDKYGYKMFRQYSKPQQWYFGVNKNRAITWDFALDLLKPKPRK